MANPTHIPTDEELIHQFQSTAELKCLESLFARHMTRIRQLIFPIVLHAGDADDLTQEVFIRAARGLHGFRGAARFSTWLNRIAINTSLTFLRSRRRKPAFAGEEELAQQPAPHASPHAEASQGELDAAIQSALGRLPPDLRAAITLTSIQGMSPAEAAAATGSLTATLYWRVHQARKQLRAELKDYLP